VRPSDTPSVVTERTVEIIESTPPESESPEPILTPFTLPEPSRPRISTGVPVPPPSLRLPEIVWFPAMREFPETDWSPEIIPLFTSAELEEDDTYPPILANGVPFGVTRGAVENPLIGICATGTSGAELNSVSCAGVLFVGFFGNNHDPSLTWYWPALIV
jgi:hypothetical protein